MTEEKMTHLREIALQQACHDFKGGAPLDRILERAKAYLDFLTKA